MSVSEDKIRTFMMNSSSSEDGLLLTKDAIEEFASYFDKESFECIVRF